jgi:hypothetical protein
VNLNFFLKYIYIFFFLHVLIVIAAANTRLFSISGHTYVATNTILLAATYVWPLIVLDYFNY